MRRTITASALIAALVLFAAPGKLSAQASSSPDRIDRIDRIDKDTLRKFFKDFGAVCASPRDWQDRDLWTFAAIVGGGILLYAADTRIQDWAQKHRSDTTNDVSGFISNFGDGFVLSTVLLGVYAAGERAGRPSWRRTALLSLESLGSTALIVFVSKFAIGRARPYAHEGNHSYEPFSTRSAYYSMPSGHAASAWAVATAIAEQSESPVVDAIAYGLAALAAASRVHDNKHWASDVFLGSALGYFTAKKICRINRPKLLLSPTLLENACLSFELAGPRRSVTLTLSW